MLRGAGRSLGVGVGAPPTLGGPRPAAARGSSSRAALQPAAAADNGMVPLPPPPPAAAAAVRSSPPPPAAAPPPLPSLFDALKFNGPAPEKVNGRIAMLALLIVAQREAATGEGIAAQLAAPSLPALAALAVVTYATLVPVLKGAREEDFGPFTVRAERVNGRAAMLGCGCLLALEALAGGACFF